jgi:hypothetical protein
MQNAEDNELGRKRVLLPHTHELRIKIQSLRCENGSTPI